MRGFCFFERSPLPFTFYIISTSVHLRIKFLFMRRILVVFFLLPLLTIAQKKQITLEDIYKKGTFRGEFVPGFTSPESDSLFDPANVVDASGKNIDTKDYQIS